MEKLAKLKIDRSDKPDVDQARSKPGKRFRLLAILAGLFALVLFLFGGALQSSLPVDIGKVTTVYPSQAYALLNSTGYVVPQTKADVASKATGRLIWMEVAEGSLVKQGEIIARLENEDVVARMKEAKANVRVAKARLNEARAELKQAGLELKRQQNLIAKQFASREAYDSAMARHEKALATIESNKASILAAQAAYRAAKVEVDYTLIRAPFDGVILSKYAEIGDVVAPFSSTTESKGSVVSMADMDTLEVEADVSESNLLKVKVGQPCEIQLDAIPESRFRCIVNRIVPTVDRSKATILVKVRFVNKDSRILPDMSAKVAFLSKGISADEQMPLTVVQTSAIISNDGSQSVFVIEGDTAKRVPVTTAELMGDMTVITNGLISGDTVVLDPSSKLQNGSKIRLPQI